ncbi:MAG: NAD(P)H-dependent flavin oxidoreductase, partial [Acidimicrobiales bacterium]
FWGDPSAVVARAHDGGALVLAQVVDVEEARRAADSGADVVVARGFEAGGHVRGKIATMALTPAVVDAVAPTPVVSAGGIGDGRGIAAALALGAAGAWIGTRFLVSEEAGLHADYVALLQTAAGSDTTYTTMFDQGWLDAPHRVIRNSTVSAWEAAGRPGPGARPGEDDVLATTSSGTEIRRYEPYTVSADFEGDIEGSSLWAGQSVGLVGPAQPAAEIVRDLVRHTNAVLEAISENREA